MLASQPKFELSVLPATIRLHIILALLGAAYAGSLLIRRRLPGPTRLDWAFAALVLAYLLAVAGSIYPRVSLEYALSAGVPVVAFFAFHDFDFVKEEWLVRGLASVGALAAGFALFQIGSDYLDWLSLVSAVEGSAGIGDLMPPAVPRVHGVGGNVNILAMALNLLLPFAMTVALLPGHRRVRLPGAAASLLILAALFFTLSRGAWLGAFAALGVFFLLYLLRGRDPGQLMSRLTHSPRRVGLLVLPVLFVLLAATVLVAARWESRPDWLFRASLSPRYDAIQVGLDIFRDRPWFGAGPGTYPLLYNAYSGEYPVENIHPHNGYVSALVDVGLAGGLVLLAGAAVTVLTLVRAYGGAAPDRRLLLAACAAAFASMAVHSLVDSPNAWNTALVPLAVVLALAMRLAGSPRPSERFSSLAPRLAPLALIPCLVLAWGTLDNRHIAYDRSIGDLREGRFAEAAYRSAVAAEKDRSLAAAQINAGVAKAILFLVQVDKGSPPDLSLLEESKVYFGRAIERDPRSAIAHANMALTLRLQAETTRKETFAHDAVLAARIAIAMAPTDGTATTAAGTVLEWAGFGEEAIYAYSRALVRDPSLAQSPFWTDRPGRYVLREPALSDFELSPCEWGRASAIYAGFPDDLDLLALRCRAEVADKPNDARLRAGLAIMLQALGRMEEASQEAEEAVRRVPDNPFALTARGVVLGARGDLRGARHELERASFLRDPYDPEAALLLAYTYEPPPPGNTVPRNLSLPIGRAEMPGPVLDRLRTAYAHAAPMVFENGRQRYALGILYYRVRFLRESPTSILIPGEWLQMSSPRALLLEEALSGK
ncbi:MAG TPA: O-antigen ligase family protein [Dehalococcoidia bacterium]|nr:O-antigen ligase family protein [Dehalococcoidia bacterium]